MRSTSSHFAVLFGSLLAFAFAGVVEVEKAQRMGVESLAPLGETTNNAVVPPENEAPVFRRVPKRKLKNMKIVPLVDLCRKAATEVKHIGLSQVSLVKVCELLPLMSIQRISIELGLSIESVTLFVHYLDQRYLDGKWGSLSEEALVNLDENDASLPSGTTIFSAESIAKKLRKSNWVPARDCRVSPAIGSTIIKPTKEHIRKLEVEWNTCGMYGIYPFEPEAGPGSPMVLRRRPASRQASSRFIGRVASAHLPPVDQRIPSPGPSIQGESTLPGRYALRSVTKKKAPSPEKEINNLDQMSSNNSPSEPPVASGPEDGEPQEKARGHEAPLFVPTTDIFGEKYRSILASARPKTHQNSIDLNCYEELSSESNQSLCDVLAFPGEADESDDFLMAKIPDFFDDPLDSFEQEKFDDMVRALSTPQRERNGGEVDFLNPLLEL